MTDLRRGGAGSAPPPREPGYRGALPPRVDRLAPIWVGVVSGILILVFVLAALGLPSRLFPEPTPLPSFPLPTETLDASSPSPS